MGEGKRGGRRQGRENENEMRGGEKGKRTGGGVALASAPRCAAAVVGFGAVIYVEIVGLAQGIRRIFVQFGLILGPLWAGSMLHQPYYMFGVMLAVNLLLTVSKLVIFLFL